MRILPLIRLDAIIIDVIDSLIHSLLERKRLVGKTTANMCRPRQHVKRNCGQMKTHLQ